MVATPPPGTPKAPSQPALPDAERLPNTPYFPVITD